MVGKLPSGKSARDGHPPIDKNSSAQIPIVIVLLVWMELQCIIIPSGIEDRLSQSFTHSLLRVVGNCPFGKQTRDEQLSITKVSRIIQSRCRDESFMNIAKISLKCEFDCCKKRSIGNFGGCEK